MKSYSFNNKNYSEEEVIDQIKKVDDFILNSNYKKRLKRVLNGISLHSKNYTLNIEKIGETSATDGKNIWLTTPIYAIFLSKQKLYSMFVALAMHEMEHILSTDMSYSKIYMQNVYEKIFENLGYNKSQIDEISHYIHNAVEDGRIERRAANRTPGYAKILKWFRYLHWYNMPIEDLVDIENKDSKALSDTLWGICTLATIGKFPRNWELYYPNTSEETTLLNNCLKHINLAVSSEDSIVCYNECFKICEILKDYIGSKLPNVPDLSDLLKNIKSSNEINEGSAPEDGKSVGNNIDIRDNDTNNKNNSSGKGNNNDSDKENGENSKKNQDKNDKNDNNGDNTKNKDTGNKNENSNQSNFKSSDIKQHGINESERTAESDKEDAELNKLNDDAEEFGSKELSKSIDTNKKKNKEDEIKEYNPTCDTLSSLGEPRIKEDDYLLIYDNHPPKSLTKSQFVTDNGKKLNKNLKPLFLFKKNDYSYNRKRGIVDTRVLTKIKTKEIDVFKKKNKHNKPDIAVYSLIDASGSMSSSQKWKNAMDTASIIEIGLKSLAPLKIAAFSYGNRCILDVIKDFSDINSDSHVQYYRLKHRPSGCNRDGLSIRIATAELMKRPEKTKILIVTCDGFPSVYDNRLYMNGEQDVRAAVKAAIDNNIQVFGIFIDETGTNHFNTFKYMYGDKRSLYCKPEQLSVLIPRIIKNNLKR